MRYFFLVYAPMLLAIAACTDESAPGTDYLLTAGEVRRDTIASEKGDSEASKRLAFHYGLIAERRLADKYLQKCMNLLNAGCFAEQANRHFLNFTDKEKSYQQRKEVLLLALKFNHLALTYADSDNSLEISNYQSQSKIFDNRLSKLNSQE